MLFATFLFKSYVWDKCVFWNMDLKMLSTNQIAGFSNLEQKQWNCVIFYILMPSDESLSLFKNFCLNLVKNGCGHHSIRPFLCWGTTFSPRFSKGRIRKKMSACRDLQSFCHGYFPWGGTYYISCQKKLSKNMALRAQFQMLILACFSQTTN